MTNLGACENFVVDLRKSNLIERGQLDQVIGDFLRDQPRPEPEGMAQYLVDQGVLTPFQAERILKGKAVDMVLGPYVLADTLGTGSMGTVYKAQSKTDQNWYAVKVLPRRSMWNVLQARRQVRAYEQCKHPAVVPFVDVGTAGGTHYLVWPFAEGESLENVVKKSGKLAPGVAAKYIAQVAEGLYVCHGQNLVHGMIKPSNLMIGPDEQVCILDVGIGSLIAQTEGESMIDTQSMANSQASGLDCVSPESIMEPTNLTPHGDQYSLGCVLYYCLTGQYPFAEDSAVAKMVAHQTKAPPPIQEIAPEVPSALADVVDRLMQKKPEDRYHSIDEIIEPLQQIAQDPAFARTAAATPEAAAPRVVPTRQSLLGTTPPAAEPAEQELEREPTAARPHRLRRASAPPPDLESPEHEPAHARLDALDRLRHSSAPPAEEEEEYHAPPPPRPTPPAPTRGGRSDRLQRLMGVESAPARPAVASPAPSPPRAGAGVPKRGLVERASLFLLKKSFVVKPQESALTPLRECFDEFIKRARSLFRKRVDGIDCTVLAPAAVPRGKAFTIYVMTHRPKQARIVAGLAREFGHRPKGDGVQSLRTLAERNAELSFYLAMAGLHIEQSTQNITWHGWPDLVQFHVHVPEDRVAGMAAGTITASQNGTPLGAIEFTVAIVGADEKTSPEPVPLGDAARRYE